MTEGGFLYNAMNDFLEAIQQVILVLKFFQAPQQYDDFPKTLFDSGVILYILYDKHIYYSTYGNGYEHVPFP